MIVLPALFTTLVTSFSPVTDVPYQDTVIEVVIDENGRPSRSRENYLPRKLYPGTYKNFCGPTPEITVKDGCRAHGWHGDDAFDEADAACQLHDISYCSCESELMKRKGRSEQTNGLSSLSALRFVTLPTLNRLGAIDEGYVKCIHKADSELISSGIKLRSENQKTNCQTNPSLGWFCEPDVGTLAAFEKVNLSIFLKDLDFDESRISKHSVSTLSRLEHKRHDDLLRDLKNGKSIADAVQSKDVQEDEEEMLQYLEISTR